MKATLIMGVLIQGIKNQMDRSVLEETLSLKAVVSIPALPEKGQTFGLADFSSTALCYESEVEEVRWYPVGNRVNVLEPWIYLKDYDLREHGQLDETTTLEQARNYIIEQIAAPLPKKDTKFGEVRFVLR